MPYLDLANTLAYKNISFLDEHSHVKCPHADIIANKRWGYDGEVV
jgi:hypothetical protein